RGGRAAGNERDCGTGREVLRKTPPHRRLMAGLVERDELRAAYHDDQADRHETQAGEEDGVRQAGEIEDALALSERRIVGASNRFGDLAAGTVVTERAWGDGVAHAPKVRSAVFTCNYETSCAVGRRAEVVRQRVAHCAGRVGEHLGLPDAGGIMQERLVIEGEVGRSR